MLPNFLVYGVLKFGNMTIRNEQLVKATTEELRNDIVKTKLLKIFSDISKVPTSDFDNLSIQPETTFHTQNMPFPEETLGQSSDYDDHVENYGLFHRTTIHHRLLQLYKRY